MARSASSHWWISSIMVLSFIVGFELALGHHLFYSSLMDKPATTSYTVMGSQFTSQQVNVVIGTAFAFLVKASFVLAVSTAYFQLLWIRVKRDSKSNRLYLSRLDIAFSGLDNIISLARLPVWAHHPLLFLTALIAWLIPFASIITPAALSVALKGNHNEIPLQDVPQIEFSNLNFPHNMYYNARSTSGSDEGVVFGPHYTYGGPSDLLRHLVSRVAIQREILPIDPPLLGSNITWAFEFHAPSLQCGSVEPDARQSLIENIVLYKNSATNSSCQDPILFLSWFPRLLQLRENFYLYHEPYYSTNDFADVEFEPDSIFKADWNTIHPADANGLIERDAVFYVAVMPHHQRTCQNYYINPDTVVGPDASIIRCHLHNSTYHVGFKYLNNIQNVDVTLLARGPIAQIVPVVLGPNATNCMIPEESVVEPTGPCGFNLSQLPQLAYQSTLQAFTSLIIGNVTTSDGVNYSERTKVTSTVLSDSKELRFLTSLDRELGIKDSPEQFTLQFMLSNITGISAAPSTQSNESLATAIEMMFQNITISLMSSPFFRSNYSSHTAPPRVEVTQIVPQTFYVYKPEKLWAAYGAATFCTFVCVFAGLCSVFASNAAYSNAFSTTFRISRTAELGVEIKQNDAEGKSPLPGYLAKASIKLGGGGSGGSEVGGYKKRKGRM